MEENYQEKKALGSMMKNSSIGRSLNLEKKQKAVLDVLIKQKITTDPGKLAGYKKEAFLKEVNKKIGLGYYGKKALNEVYGEKKDESVRLKNDQKPKTALNRDSYDEIMAKRKSPAKETSGKTFFAPKIVRDNSGLRGASSFAKVAGIMVSEDEPSDKSGIKSRLKEIQS